MRATLDALNWHENWAGFGESAYSLMAKLHALNGVSKGYLASQFTGALEASFTSPRSTKGNAVARRIVQASVASQLGTMFAQLAGDDCLRYCKTCLRGGYHAAAYQLDVFERCAVHDEPLLEVCSSCGRQAPRFVLTKGRGFPSFACSHCGQHLAGGVAPHQSPQAWVLPESLARVRSIHDWAAKAAQSIELIAPTRWITCAPQAAAERRVALALAITKMAPCPITWRLRHKYVDVTAPVTMDRSSPCMAESTYLKFARALLPQEALGSEFWRDWASTDGGLQLPIELTVCPQLHAAYIWRCQFERTRPVGLAGNHHALPDRPVDDAIERWLAPYEGRASLVLSDELRVTMARAAWHASLRIASDWRIWLEAANAERRRPRMDEHWLARLGRWDATTALPIGMALKKLPDCPDDMFLYLC